MSQGHRKLPPRETHPKLLARTNPCSVRGTTWPAGGGGHTKFFKEKCENKFLKKVPYKVMMVN